MVIAGRAVAILLACAACTQAAGEKPSSRVEEPAPVPRIELKGLALGMTKKEVEAVLRDPAAFTIGGVGSKFSGVNLGYRDGRLDTLMFFFEERNFEQVLEAVQGKYPALNCKGTAVPNRAGTAFTPTECTLPQVGGRLDLSRYIGDTSASCLSLVSDAWSQRSAELAEKQKKDI